MGDIIDNNKALRTDKNKKIAFITFLIALVLLLIKFIFFYTTFLMIDSPWIPDYSISFALQDSYLSGIIMSTGSIISFILYNKQKYTVSLIINTVIIINHFIFPYIYYASDININ